jgi:hypothetical protein
MGRLFDAEQDTLALDGFSVFEVEELTVRFQKGNPACASNPMQSRAFERLSTQLATSI